MPTHTQETNRNPQPASAPGALLGEADVEQLAVAWLETRLQITPDDDTVNWKHELRDAKREMRRALNRAGMYRRPNK